MDSRIVGRLHHQVVLLQLNDLRLELSSCDLMILIGLLKVFVALFVLGKLNLDLLVYCTQVLTLIVPALEFL